MPVGNEWVSQIRIKVGGADISHEIMDKVLDVIVDSSLYLPDMLIINLTDDDDLSISEGHTFDIGKPVEVEFGQPDESRTTVPVFKGEITAIEPTYGEDLVAMLTVRGYDKGHRLTRGTKIRVFKDMTDGDIVNKIASENGLSPTVEDPGEVYKHVYQHSQTDLDFLQQRAQRIGYEVFVDDTKLYFRKPAGSRGDATLKWGEGLRSFKPRLSMGRQVGKVIVLGWDPDQKKQIRGQATSSTSSPQIGFGKTGVQASSTFGSSEEVVVRRPVRTQREADMLAKALLDEINAGFVEADGVTHGLPSIKAGMKVKIEQVGAKFAGTYIVTAARHVYTPEDYATQFTVQGARPQLMSDLVENQSVFADHDPYFGGVVPAIVVNLNDPDNKGRVEVKYPWLDDNLKSDWARVAAVGAGKNRGFLWMPEVDDEVLVAFEHGDFNRPYIIGSLWNGKDNPPEAWNQAVQSGKSEIRIMKSREGHIIRMVDGPGATKYIEIIDSAQGTTIKLDAQTNKLSIDSKDEISVTTKTNMKINTTANVEIKATGNVNIEGNGTVTVKATGSASVEASGPLTLKGAMVNIN